MEDGFESLTQTYRASLTAEYMSIATTTLIAYDWITSLSVEIQHVWLARWTYGRAAFHFNRIWSVVALGVFVPMNFRKNMTPKTSVPFS
ncbi:hypothetical protein BDV93DRAFT_327059 [Ceratobasidium sp. AG-I]|nr:hypothetical protein BDV93DRAFT_327059 [Ceratobasidium sp. AG-I]